MSRSFLLIYIVLSILLTVPGVCLSGANSQATVYLDYDSEANSQIIEIAVWATGTQHLKGFDIEITVNSTQVIILDEVKEGSFLRSLGGKAFFMPKLSKGGKLWVANAVEGNDTSYTPSGKGALFTFKVQILDHRTSDMQLSKVLSLKKVVFADSNLEKDHVVGEVNR